MALPKPSNVVDWQGAGGHFDASLGQKDRSTTKGMTMCHPIRLSIDARAGAASEQLVICGMMMRRRLQDRLCSRTVDGAALMNGPSVARYLPTACPKPRHAASPWLI